MIMSEWAAAAKKYLHPGVGVLVIAGATPQKNWEHNIEKSLAFY